MNPGPGCTTTNLSRKPRTENKVMKPPEYFLFDLDNTLYDRRCGLFAAVDARINRYLEEFVGIPTAELDWRRRAYWQAHGTTLNGLMIHHGVEPLHYLDYVHDVDLSLYLAADPELGRLLARLPGKKYIFSNASRKHCRRVLERLGVAEFFAGCFTIEYFSFRPKPDPAIYRELLAEIGGRPAAGVMVDDLPVNLEPAAALGLTTFLLAPEAAAPQPAGFSGPRRISQLAELLEIG